MAGIAAQAPYGRLRGSETRLRVIQGRRGVPTEVVVRQTTLDDLVDEVTALDAEAQELLDRALPLARQLRIMAYAIGPTSCVIAEDLIALLERHERQHSPRRVA